jgi:hypothetical protein
MSVELLFTERRQIMFKRCMALILGCSLLLLLSAPAAAAKSKEEKRALLVEKVRAGILTLGVGRDARVEIRLQNRTRLTGYVSEVKDDSFTISNSKTGTATTVAYSDVTAVKGHNLSTGAKIAIGIGIGVGLVFLILAIMAATTGIG